MIDRNKERYKKRMRQLILLYFVITLIFGIFLTILLMNAFSDKKKLREEGLAAFEKGDYAAAEPLNEVWMKISGSQRVWTWIHVCILEPVICVRAVMRMP